MHLGLPAQPRLDVDLNSCFAELESAQEFKNATCDFPILVFFWSGTKKYYFFAYSIGILSAHAAKFRFIKSHSYNILDTFYIVINREIKVH